MRKVIFIFLLLFSVSVLKAQELNCLVTINYKQVDGSNTQVFKTLEKSLSEFVNQTKWTNNNVKPEERIDCAFTIIITSRDANNFKGTIQVQSTRPVFGSSYASPVLNLKDNDFNFKYNEFDPLIYNKNSYDSNLISTIVFYTNIIIGADADTFKKNGGEASFKVAENVMLQAQQSGIASWQNVVGKQTRFLLIDSFLSPKLSAYRTATYNYHRRGLDEFSINNGIAKQNMEEAVISLESIYNKTVGNYLIRVFFDAKADEIVNMYTDDATSRNQNRLKEVVKKISPNNNSKWKNIK
ncbi:DUF4835 family protein [Polaribacter sp. Z014]|uniref:type IX secretion system protein PorD n=1 Tax=unclassified Polaribacter TaxID=196858 RepID=UPI00193B869B|nr:MULTISPECIES: DUF4835 family protein [unclassified Polaribacter]MCL7763116.1 DUF4835 family protein [Polaribacter sp. Z014]QVY65461.1 DUF4835 family protein [Polaribacter sp. Q13]